MVRSGSEEWRRGLQEREGRRTPGSNQGEGEAVVSDKDSGTGRPVSTLISLWELGGVREPL